MMTPYTGIGNNPINYYDPDGNYIYDYTPKHEKDEEGFGASGGSWSMIDNNGSPTWRASDGVFQGFNVPSSQGYSYSYTSGNYYNSSGDNVTWYEVYNNYVIPNGTTYIFPDLPDESCPNAPKIHLTAQGNTKNPPVGGNSTTEIFTDINEAYIYMWQNSFDSNWKPYVELSAWITTIGIVVMPFYNNGVNYSRNDYLNLNYILRGVTFVQYEENKWALILGHIHTHPDYQNDFGISESDFDFRDYYQIPCNIVWSGHIWQIKPKGRIQKPLYKGKLRD